MMSANPITKEVMENCFKELGKQYKKVYGKYVNIEIVLVGGAAVLANHSFRDMTMDIDAYIGTNASINDLIHQIGDEMGLAEDWLNQDFIRTNSFSPKLREYSRHYRTYSNVLEVRILSDPYLIATKLMAGRTYKRDLSDIIGILRDNMSDGEIITRTDIMSAFSKLYDNTDKMPAASANLIDFLYPGETENPVKDIEQYMQRYLNLEEKSKAVLLDKQNAGIVLNEKYVEEITKFINDVEEKEVKAENENVFFYHKHR